MTEPGRPSSPNDFERRLRAARARSGKPASGEEPGRAVPRSAFGVAFRIGIELVAGLVIGGGIGFFLDEWLGTSPLMLILFFLLGAAAGIVNVYRDARRVWQSDLSEDDGGGDAAPRT